MAYVHPLTDEGVNTLVMYNPPATTVTFPNVVPSTSSCISVLLLFPGKLLCCIQSYELHGATPHRSKQKSDGKALFGSREVNLHMQSIGHPSSVRAVPEPHNPDKHNVSSNKRHPESASSTTMLHAQLGGTVWVGNVFPNSQAKN
eukprot:6490167-Amphidinium_carterae.1